jgi:hypothetical protein
MYIWILTDARTELSSSYPINMLSWRFIGVSCFRDPKMSDCTRVVALHETSECKSSKVKETTWGEV